MTGRPKSVVATHAHTQFSRSKYKTYNTLRQFLNISITILSSLQFIFTKSSFFHTSIINIIMGIESVMVDEVAFPSQITTTKPLSLLGHGITDIEIHFLQIKFTAIGVYLEPEVVKHLAQWKGKSGKDLAEDDDFFDALIAAPVEKFLRVVTIKEIKGSQYGVQLESAVRDRLAADDKYEEEEEEALEKVVEFLQGKYFKKDTVITFLFPATTPCTAEISLVVDGKDESKITVSNANVAEMIQKWYLGGTRGVSPTTILSLASALATELSK